MAARETGFRMSAALASLMEASYSPKWKKHLLGITFRNIFNATAAHKTKVSPAPGVECGLVIASLDCLVQVE